MTTVFIYTFRRLRGAVIGWGLGLALLGGWLVRFYDTLEDQQDQLAQLIKAYPPELMAAFGDMTQLFTPGGYLHTEFFSYMPLILGIFVLSMGSALLAGEEESGILDLLLSYPISRTRLFFGKLLAYLAAIFSMLALIWMAFLLFIQGTRLEGITAGEMALPFISLGALLIFFGALALLLSMILPSQRSATMMTSLFLFASFFFTVMSRMDDNLEGFEKFFPFHYYQGGEALHDMNWLWIGILVAFAALMFVGTWGLFERRDVRVSGERGGFGFNFRGKSEMTGSGKR
jgi:ABC-2 type transport system permease protein